MIKLKNIIKEIEEPVYPISKMEEAYGLRLILKKLLPVNVNNHNRRVFEPEDIVEKREVAQNLRKTENDVDQKIYKSTVRNKTFIFGISKRYDFIGTGAVEPGTLCIGDFGNTTTKEWYWYSVDDFYDNEITALFENQQRVYPKLNKQDEDVGLSFIKRYVIPFAVKSWDKFYSGDITVDQVRHGLTKKEHKKWPEPQFSDYILYQFSIPRRKPAWHPNIIIDFKIWNDQFGNLMAGYEHPMSRGVVSYYVDDPSIEQDLTEENQPNINPRQLSKEELDEALRYLKNVIIPLAAGNWEQKAGYSIPEGDILQNLKRTPFEKKKSNQHLVFYVSDVGDTVFSFYIAKNAHYQTIRIYWKHMLMKDYQRYEIDPHHGHATAIYENMNKKELMQDKKTLDKALSLIKRIAVPDVVKKHNAEVAYFHSHPESGTHRRNYQAYEEDAEKRGFQKFVYRPTTPEEVLKYLKRVTPFRPYLVEFQSTIPGGMLFLFYINYSEVDGWGAGWEMFDERREWHLDASNMLDFDTLDREDMGLDENKKIELKESDYLTKKEEDYGYRYLVNVVLPKAVNDVYLKHLKPSLHTERKYPRITADDIAKRLVKTRVSHDRVAYEAVISDHVSFDFLVVKEYHLTNIQKEPPYKETWDLAFIIGVNGPFDDKFKYKWYDVE